MNIAVNPGRIHDDCEAAVIGAGPYGLAAAAHLRAAGFHIRVFGEAVGFWRDNMPVGMKLRSPWIATDIAHPDKRLTLDEYYRGAGLAKPQLLPLEKFVDYGRWFQAHVAPDIDRRKVLRVAACDSGFRVTLADGETFFAKRVVMALGLLGHEFRPSEFAGMPRELVSHSCEHTASDIYKGRKVAVIGRGQSACESAALLHEAGADVEIICRGTLAWNADPTRRGALRKAARALVGDRLIPPSEVGPFPDSWLNEAPGIIHRFSQGQRDRHNVRSLGPTAILWLRDRMKDIPVNQRRRILDAQRTGDKIAVTLDDGVRRYDHVLCATGYRIDVARMDIFDGILRARIARHNGLPVLADGLQSSVPGLHFIGAAAVGSYGPLLRFIAGAGYAARHVTRAALRGRKAQGAETGARSELLSLATGRE